MFDRNSFENDKRINANQQSSDEDLQKLALNFLIASDKYAYGYQWSWLGLPMIQLPPDILVVQELIWETKPDLIIETGIAWGGSLVYYASILQLLEHGAVIGIDVTIPQHNIDAIMNYPFSNRITLYQGSSTDPDIQNKVEQHIDKDTKVMVLLDSNHTHQHVLDELNYYANFVTQGQYLIVSDTIVEEIPKQDHRPRPWAPGNNPKTALSEYLKTNDRFEIDEYINNKLLTTFTPNGYLKCIK